MIELLIPQRHANRASNATYTVTHGGGNTNVTVNQQANGGAWKRPLCSPVVPA